MASPQIDDGAGYTRISNELLEALYRTNFSAYESRVFWCVLRQTYGYGKKTDRISISQIAKKTGLDRGHAGRSLARLKERNMILADGEKIGIQKDYDIWGVPLQAPPVPIKAPVPLQATKPRASTGTTKDIRERNKITAPKNGAAVSPKARSKKSGNEPAAGHAETMALWCRLFKEKNGTNAPIRGGRDGGIISDLLKTRGATEVQGVMQYFYDNPSWRVATNGEFSLTAFMRDYTQTLVLWKRQQPAAPANGNGHLEPPIVYGAEAH